MARPVVQAAMVISEYKIEFGCLQDRYYLMGTSKSCHAGSLGNCILKMP
jgi:hypothetical protein